MLKETMSIADHDHQLGNPTAKLTLIEYGDYQCVHCARAHPLLDRLMNQFDNELLFVFRNFPLREMHPSAMIAACSAEAAGLQGKFWEMHSMIFKNQKVLSSDYTIYCAEELNLNIDEFLRDRMEDSILTKIDRDFEIGIRSGVNATPSFFLNGVRFNKYDETYESLHKLIKNALNQ